MCCLQRCPAPPEQIDLILAKLLLLLLWWIFDSFFVLSFCYDWIVREVRLAGHNLIFQRPSEESSMPNPRRPMCSESPAAVLKVITFQ